MKKNKFSILLIFGSLLLLLMFQVFWLKNVFETEKQAVVDGADELFVNAVRSIEDSLFYSVWFEPLSQFDSLLSDSLKIDVEMNTDSNMQIFMKQARDISPKNTNDTASIRVDIRSDMNVIKENKNFGSIAFMMASEKEMKLDTIFNGHPFQHASLEMIKEELATKFPNKDLPQTYDVILITENQNEKPGLLSSSHTDKLSKEIFAIHFPNYKFHVFKKIIPQVLFSIFLFSVLALSFYMVWKNLDEQRRLTELKNDFISNVTHELKTPITTVGVALEALSNFNALNNPERTEEYLNISKHELSRLSILVDKVLKMSMFEKKEPELKMELLDMQSMILEVLASMKLQFEKVSAKVNFETNGSQFFLKGDKIHLTSVVYNLIDNALKYSKSNPEINLLLENNSEEVQFTIADNGIGISNNNQDKIFEKFFRVPQGDQHDVKGYGLGLSYVSSVVKKHQGNIHVKSQLNKGTSFTISLPNSNE